MSKWKLHYATLGPETVLVPETYPVTIDGVDAALASADVQHVDERTGVLSRGSHYWSRGGIVKYELLDAPRLVNDDACIVTAEELAAEVASDSAPSAGAPEAHGLDSVETAKPPVSQAAEPPAAEQPSEPTL